MSSFRSLALCRWTTVQVTSPTVTESERTIWIGESAPASSPSGMWVNRASMRIRTASRTVAGRTRNWVFRFQMPTPLP